MCYTTKVIFISLFFKLFSRTEIQKFVSSYPAFIHGCIWRIPGQARICLSVFQQTLLICLINIALLLLQLLCSGRLCLQEAFKLICCASTPFVSRAYFFYVYFCLWKLVQWESEVPATHLLPGAQTLQHQPTYSPEISKQTALTRRFQQSACPSCSKIK